MVMLLLTAGCSSDSNDSSRDAGSAGADASIGGGGAPGSGATASGGGTRGSGGAGGNPSPGSGGAAGTGGTAADASLGSRGGAGANGAGGTRSDASLGTGGAAGRGADAGAPPVESGTGTILDAATDGNPVDGGGGPGCVRSFSTAGDHLCVARKDGALWCWGNNNLGGVGDGTTFDRRAPSLVTALGPKVTSVADGWAYGCATTSDNTLSCWGDLAYGKLGTGTTGVECRADGSLYSSAPCEPAPVRVPTLDKGVIQVSAGFWHTCAIQNDHTLWCWGESSDGDLGVGMPASAQTPAQVTALGSEVAEVQVGSRHTCARKLDGTLWCWGQTDFGALGLGTTAGDAGFGGEHGQALPLQVTALGNGVAEIAAGGYHTCARKTDGTVWCWGNNANGELGDGTTEMKLSPVQVTALGTTVAEIAAGSTHSCARKADGSLWCWGGNAYGQVGDGTPTNRPTPVAALVSDTIRVEAGGSGTCAEKSDGSLWCWGSNSAGMLDGGTSGEKCSIQVYVPGDPFGGGGGYVTEQLDCRKSPTLIDGVCQAEADFGGPLTITGGACTSTTDGGTASAWPASPTSFPATCTPNCGADTCASYCPSLDSNGLPTGGGMPCDTGCCASNKAQVSDFGSGQSGPRLGAVGAAPSGRVFYGSSRGSDIGDFSVAWSDDDGASWAGLRSPDLAQTNPTYFDQIALAIDPQFAFGGTAATAEVYMAYELAAVEPFGPPYFPGSPLRGRLGVGMPLQGQTWEDLPTATGALAADSSGALWVNGNKVYRRAGKRTWDAICMPNPGGSGAAMAVDGAGAWYVARSGSDGNVYVSRRTPDGQWNTEMVAQGSATAIALGAGTVHVAYLRSGNVYYARRVGTAWVESLAVVGSALPANVAGEHVAVTLAYLAVDACGSPHFGVYAENGANTFDAYYVRWTAAGWVSSRFWSSCDPQLSGGVALSASRAFLPTELCGWSVLGIPLK